MPNEYTKCLSIIFANKNHLISIMKAYGQKLNYTRIHLSGREALYTAKVAKTSTV